MTKIHEPERDFEQRLRSRLQARADDLDEQTRGRLRAARRKALDQLDQPRRATPRWLPAGALAASLALVAVLVVVRNERPVGEFVAGSEIVAEVDDLVLLSADEDLELLEDLEFFRWLDGNENGDAG